MRVLVSVRFYISALEACVTVGCVRVWVYYLNFTGGGSCNKELRFCLCGFVDLVYICIIPRIVCSKRKKKKTLQ